MIKYAALAATVVALALAAPGKPVAPSGTWKVDSHRSDAQLTTDGTTDFGKKNIAMTIGFGRVNGTVKLDANDSSNSKFDFRFYPASSMDPPINEEGRASIEWFSNVANNTLVCFHSKGAQQTADGRLRTTGTLVLTRVDRNVESAANEAYAGPVYGPPILHRVSREATFVFDMPAADASSHDDPAVRTAGSTSMAREDFPPLFRAITATQWPAVVQDKNCEDAVSGEAYAGSRCTGTFLIPSFPLGPHETASEAYPGPHDFNSIVGMHLTIAVHMRLTPAGSGSQSFGGN
jgi:polyisoprenoid-binding protein YceI